MGDAKTFYAQRSNQGSANQGNFGKPVLRPERQSHLVDSLNKTKEFSNDAQVINSPVFCDISNGFWAFCLHARREKGANKYLCIRRFSQKQRHFPLIF
jgi:hypothetical protein